MFKNKPAEKLDTDNSESSTEESSSEDEYDDIEDFEPSDAEG